MGSAESKELPARLQRAALATVRFPSKFEIYYDDQSGLKLFLGEKNNPSKMVSMPGGWHSGAIMYNGNTMDADPVAVILGISHWSKRDHFLLAPSQPGQQLDFGQDLRSHHRGFSTAYVFEISTGRSLRPEKFMWHSSHGEAVRALDEALPGWKLLRLGHGDEVVAVAAEAAWLGRASRKVGVFEFAGSGATGELGEAWAVMAVASFVTTSQLLANQIAIGAILIATIMPPGSESSGLHIA